MGAAVRVVAALHVPGVLVEAGGVPLLSDLRVEQSLYAATSGFGGLVGDATGAQPLQSATRLGAKALFTEIDASLAVDARAGDEQTVGIDAHHSLRVPWLPAYPAFPLALTDTLDFSHRQGERQALHTLGLQLGGTWGSAEAEMQGGTAGGLLTQTTAAAAYDGPAIAGDARLSLTRLSDAPTGLVGRYADDWLTTTSLLVLGSDDTQDRERAAELTMSARVGSTPVAGLLAASSELRSAGFFQPQPEATLRTDLTLTVPVAGDRGWSVRPGYRRQAATTIDRAAATGW